MLIGKDYIGVGCGALILDKHEKVLLLKRKKAPEAGKWTIPGGKVAFGETIEDAITREVKEELNVTIEIISLLGVTNHILPEENAHWVAPLPEFHIHLLRHIRDVTPKSWIGWGL